MNHLLRSLVQIALFRKDPSVLPASTVLLVLLAAAYGALNTLNAWIIFGPDRAFARGAADLVLALAVFWLLLSLWRRRDRFRQSMSAVFGTHVVISPFVTGVLMLPGAMQGSQAVTMLVLVASAIVISWYTMIVAHIVRSAIEVDFITSIVIALLWLFAGELLLNRLFAMSA